MLGLTIARSGMKRSPRTRTSLVAIVGGVGVADVASCLNGMSSEVESSVCVCLQRGVVWALVVVVELVCEVQCVERDGGRTAVHVFCHVTAVCLTFMYSPSHPIIARRCRIGARPTSISAIAATEHHSEGKHTLSAPGGGGVLEESDIVVVVLPACNYRNTSHPQPPCNC